jgi:hypothetical protein
MHNDIIEVTKVLEAGGGFGLTAAGDKVYIPRSVTAAARVASGQRYHAVLVPNAYAPERNPFMAVRVASRPTDFDLVDAMHDYPLIEDPQDFIDDMGAPTNEEADIAPEHERPRYDDVANWALQRVLGGGKWTLRNLMLDAFGAGQYQRATHIRYMVAISNKLNYAHRRGELARAEVRQSADQLKPSRIVWAANWKDLF